MTLMTRQEAQAYLRKSKSALYRAIKAGIIQKISIGGKPLFVKEHLDAIIRKQLRNARA